MIDRGGRTRGEGGRWRGDGRGGYISGSNTGAESSGHGGAGVQR